MMFQKRFFFCLLAVVVQISSVAGASDFSTIVQLIKPAILKIEVLYQNVPVSFGTGFFVSADGLILTNQHVVAPAFNKGFTLRIKFSTGDFLPVTGMVSCSINPEPDLCLIKVDTKPKFWINPQSNAVPREGLEILALGHPQGLEFTVSNGIISAMRPQRGAFFLPNFQPERIQITAPISPGNSGGPVVDAKGNLVGVVASGIFSAKAQNLNFAVPLSVVQEFMSSKHQRKQQDFFSFQTELFADLKEASQRLYKLSLKPILDSGKFDLAEIRSIQLQEQNLKMQFLVPRAFSPLDCGMLEGAMTCLFPEGDLISIMVLPSQKKDLRSTLHRFTPKPEPLGIVNAAIKDPDWDRTYKSLTENQKKFLFSQPKPWECKQIKRKLIPPKMNEQIVEYCDQFTYNARDPGMSSVVAMVQKKGSSNNLVVGAFCRKAANCILIFGVLDLVVNSVMPLP